MTHSVCLGGRVNGTKEIKRTASGEKEGAAEEHCRVEESAVRPGKGEKRGPNICPLRPSCPPQTLHSSVFPSPTLLPPSNAPLTSLASIWIHPLIQPRWPALAAPTNIALAQAMATEIRGPAAIVSLPVLLNEPTPWTALLALVHLTPYPQAPPTILLPTTETHRPRWLQRAIHRRQRLIRSFLPV